MQAIARIFELKVYNKEKYFELVIYKIKGYSSFLYKTLKKNRAREAKLKIKTWSKVEKHIGNGFIPSSYKQDLYLKVTSLSQEIPEMEEYIREFEKL